MRILGLLVACILLAGPAAALSASFDGDEAPITPDTTRAFTLHIEATCEDLATAGTLWPLAEEAELRIAFDAPENVIVTGPGTVSVPTCQNTQPVSVSQEYQIGITRDAPGRTPMEVTATVTLSNGQTPVPAGGSTSTEAVVVIEAASMMLLQAAVDQPTQIGEEDLEFPVALTNFGNTPVDLTFTVAAIDGPISLWDPHVPAPVRLARAGDDQDGTIALLRIVKVPDTGGGQTTYRYTVASQAPDGTQGDPVFITVVARAAFAPQESTPAPGLPLLVLAIAVAARRRL